MVTPRLQAVEKLPTYFTPHHPISLPDFLAGRISLLYRVQDAANTEGLHVALWGDRGTGKTSIARVLAYLMQEREKKDGRRAILVTCTSEDNYSTLWRKVLQEILVAERQLGFRNYEAVQITGRLNIGESGITDPNDLRILVGSFPNPVVIVIDEFDRFSKSETDQRMMADTIKLFADTGVQATVVLVGVAESIDNLLTQHRSIGRNLREIKVTTMDAAELAEIIQKGFAGSGFTFEPGLDREVGKLSQGYPYYTHLMGLWLGRIAADHNRTHVEFSDLPEAIRRTIENSEASLRLEYDKAIDSTHTEALFKDVLLACAQARKDSLGRFSLGDVREPLSRILGRDSRRVSYQGHLAKFCGNSRGPVLKRTGSIKSYKWQFVNPQLIPFIELQEVQGELESETP